MIEIKDHDEDGAQRNIENDPREKLLCPFNNIFGIEKLIVEAINISDDPVYVKQNEQKAPRIFKRVQLLVVEIRYHYQGSVE
jgi:hypothetical protein